MLIHKSNPYFEFTYFKKVLGSYKFDICKDNNDRHHP